MARSVHRALTVNHADHETQTGLAAQNSVLSSKRKGEGKSIMDSHHMAGKANADITLQVPANDHRAHLTEAQHDWPKSTLENPDGNLYLKNAALIRGFIDVVDYLQD